MCIILSVELQTHFDASEREKNTHKGRRAAHRKNFFNLIRVIFFSLSLSAPFDPICKALLSIWYQPFSISDALCGMQSSDIIIKSIAFICYFSSEIGYIEPESGLNKKTLAAFFFICFHFPSRKGKQK